MTLTYERARLDFSQQGVRTSERTPALMTVSKSGLEFLIQSPTTKINIYAHSTNTPDRPVEAKLLYTMLFDSCHVTSAPILVLTDARNWLNSGG